jgi:catechol 2,3-dioxygenase-like lactoylglutathione lyase family enzyme
MAAPSVADIIHATLAPAASGREAGGGDAVKIEHTAYQVEDPVRLGRWYADHLGMTIKRAEQAPPFGHFLGDDGDAVMLEFYHHPSVAQPDYRAVDPLVLHIAFRTDDVAATRARLSAAGATAVGEVRVTDAGDQLAMLRDPWGLAIQLVHWTTPMIP